MATVLFFLAVFTALALRVIKPLNATTLRALLAHRPLAPYQAATWWGDGLLRFVRTAWKALLVIETIFLSALVAADLRDAHGRSLTSRWYGGMGAVLVWLATVLLVGLASGAALQIWRITNEDDWVGERRSVVDCLAPVLPLAALILLGWASIVS